MNGNYEQEVLERVQEVQTQMLRDVMEVARRHHIEVFVLFGSAIGVLRHQGFIPWDDDIDLGLFREDYDRLVQAMKKEYGEKYEILSCETNPHYACTVTHLQKKGTKFLSFDDKDCAYTPGIHIDFFLYDHLADCPIARGVQYAQAWVLGRLLYISGEGHVVVPVKGLAGKVMEGVIACTRWMLRRLHITPQVVYRWYRSVVGRYRTKKTKYYVAFETPRPWTNAMSKEQMYPLKKAKFRDVEVYLPKHTHAMLTRIFGDYMQLPPLEKRINHRPYQIDFGEDLS